MLWNWKSTVAASLAGLLWMSAPGFSATGQSSSANEEHRQHHTYLGIKVETVRPGMIKNLPGEFRPGQGVFVAGVIADSPAEKAGIQPHDIVMSFDDQKIFSPQQFVGLVRSDKTGREAELTVLRNGKPEQIKVTLGGQDMKYAERNMKNESGADAEAQPSEK